jgi:hypothetical protein
MTLWENENQINDFYRVEIVRNNEANQKKFSSKFNHIE